MVSDSVPGSFSLHAKVPFCKILTLQIAQNAFIIQCECVKFKKATAQKKAHVGTRRVVRRHSNRVDKHSTNLKFSVLAFWTNNFT